MPKVHTGLEQVIQNPDLIKNPGKIGILCHAASIDSQYNHIIDHFFKIYPSQVIKLFGPQHGLITTVQDNMVETDHQTHPHYQLPIYSLYSETRKPTKEMLQGLNTFVIDLQDIGTRVYTYIWTVYYSLQACKENNIKVVILDRPNPINGIDIEGNILERNFQSFVGLKEIPMRHGLTIGEISLYLNNEIHADLQVIKMKGWSRAYYFEQTQLPWVLPSPNLPTSNGAYFFPGTVLFEGTNISEGRGTTRSLEIIGHPRLDPYQLINTIRENSSYQSYFSSVFLRPIYFQPTFNKHINCSCGGIQLHIKSFENFKPWFIGQILMKEIFNQLGDDFQWKKTPYEYEFEKNAIDMINGTDLLREWIEDEKSTIDELQSIEQKNRKKYLMQREKYLLY